MEQALRSHRGGTVLALGIMSLVAGLLLVPLGIVAWIMGSKDLRAMNRGELDPAGRSLTQMGWAFGIGGLVCMIGPAACIALLVVGGERYRSETSSTFSRGDGTRTVTSFYSRSGHGSPALESEHQEVERPNGAWVKEGRATRWSRDGKKLEEGSYRNGKRDAEWTFWHEDGSIDLAQSGIYEDDVRVQSGATPPGDYPHSPRRLDSRPPPR